MRRLLTLALLGVGSAGACGAITQPQWVMTVRAANYAGLDALLLTALTWEESQYCKDAVSPVGAQGLTQLMPDTARELGVTAPFDEQQNLYGGALYLRRMYQQFGDWEHALLAYHDGAGNVAAGRYSQAGVSYVSNVLGRYAGMRASPQWVAAWR